MCPSNSHNAGKHSIWSILPAMDGVLHCMGIMRCDVFCLSLPRGRQEERHRAYSLVHRLVQLSWIEVNILVTFDRSRTPAGE